jgi:hypothetical protein
MSHEELKKKILEGFEEWWDSFRPTDKMMPDFYDIKSFFSSALDQTRQEVLENVRQIAETIKKDSHGGIEEDSEEQAMCDACGSINLLLSKLEESRGRQTNLQT